MTCFAVSFVAEASPVNSEKAIKADIRKILCIQGLRLSIIGGDYSLAYSARVPHCHKLELLTCNDFTGHGRAK